MKRASLIGAAVLAVALAAPGVRADDEPRALDTSIHPAEPAHAPRDTREALSDQLAAEQGTLDRALATDTGKLTAADSLRLRRVRAAARVLHAPIAADASDGERMIVARRRAAARLLLERDAADTTLLATEIAHVHSAQQVAASAATQVPTIALPETIGWPAAGKIVRKYGTLVHDRSHATLSRRGIDLEVAENATVSAPADGIVRYAGPIRGLDHGVVLDHGSYTTVVAKLGELAIPIGTHVARGDHLGRALRHRVYLEVRVAVGPGGLPIDPEPLLSKH